jgi:hypothetical protein
MVVQLPFTIQTQKPGHMNGGTMVLRNAFEDHQMKALYDSGYHLVLKCIIQ